ncbi:hypothetical protein F4781DRAFT_444183 [Annulohypoxylon bovei var. microspora]|nr:hypothetical protein F4781DRAFT_444183 [Annulohypoxylon bovei var. microspora]
MKEEPTLRYRKTPIFLLVIYLPTLIVPWVLICIMTKRPLGSSSYYDQTGAHYKSNVVGVLIAEFLKTTNAVLAVPIISALLAHAAIVYAMRRQRDQKLNVQQLFALADKGWSNYFLLLSAGFRGRCSPFLFLAALLVILGSALQPLMSVLVTFDSITAMSCLDLPIGGCYKEPMPIQHMLGFVIALDTGSQHGRAIVAYDPEPADMPRLQRDLILHDVLGQLVTVSDLEAQPNLWPVSPDLSGGYEGYEKSTYKRMFAYYDPEGSFDPDSFFVSALESGTNTGVLREHALRLNSSVHCEHIPQSGFPSPCPGVRPFEIHFERLGLKLDVCVPGNATLFPFTPSRNRQDITEDLYIHQETPMNNFTRAPGDNFTIHCTASTSRGYFELGNEQNNYVYGPLLSKWPGPADIETNSNDFRRGTTGYVRPTEEDPSSAFTNGTMFLPGERSIGYPFNDFYDADSASVPGPLMVSAEVLFGNYSFLQFITDNSTGMTPMQVFAGMCEHGNIPFSQVLGIILYDEGPLSHCGDVADRVNYTDDETQMDDELTFIVGSHVRRFNTTSYAEYALIMSMYFANRAVLTKTALAEIVTGDAREIYYSPGTAMARPSMATASMIAITILISLQTLGLAVVACFIYSVPAWAPAFDAMEVARIGKALPDNILPPLGPVTRKDEERLARIDALVGGSTIEGDSDGKRQGRYTTGMACFSILL